MSSESPQSPQHPVPFQRRWTRFQNKEETVTLLTADRPSQLAEILDESFGGMGLKVADATGLDPGIELQVIYCGAPMWCVVRVVRQEADGGYFVGVEWRLRAGGAESPSRQPVAAQATPPAPRS